MRKTILTQLKGLLWAVLLAGTVISCENEKPDIYIPPVPKEFKYIESLIPDTVSFGERDSIIINLRTTPYNLLNREEITIQITDTAGIQYEYASITSVILRPDSVWNIGINFLPGLKDGDAVLIKVTDDSDILYSDPIILNPVKYSIEALEGDTLTFYEGTYPVIRVRTSPYNLLSKKGADIQICDARDSLYKYATIKSVQKSDDNIWYLDVRMEYGMKNGDTVKVCVKYLDLQMYSKTIVLNMIPKPIPDYHAIEITSGPISAFDDKECVAAISFRTVPWNLLLNDSIKAITTLTDTLGNPVTDLFSVQTKYFMPDSTWYYEIMVKNTSISSSYVAFTITMPDDIVRSEPVMIKKATFSMWAVRVGSLNLDYDENTQTYSRCMPTTTNFSAQKFYFTHSGERLTYGDRVLSSGDYNIIDANEPFKVTLWYYGVKKEYTIKVYNTKLPIVKIETYGQSVDTRDTWVSGATMRIVKPDGTIDYEGSLSLKGRGNGTWTETLKKPYAIRLNEKAKILGMHKQKRWILLANYKDRTLLRNDAALWLSRNTEMPYTVSGQFVELVWNGKHMGNYYLCEQARIDNHRIDIVSPKLDDPGNGGIFMEIDAFLDYNNNGQNGADKVGDVGFWSEGASKRYKLPYIFKDPDQDENGIPLTSSDSTYKYMQKYVNEMENAIYNASSTNHDWMNYLDMDRAIDYVLIQEITMNHDSYNNWPVAGPHSAFLYKDSCGPICFGPTWDFDYHTFTLYNDFSQTSSSWNSNENSRLRQWELLKMDNKNGNKYYFADLVKKDPLFKARLLKRWNLYKYTWKQGFPAYLDQMAEYIRVSESCNRKLWGTNGGSVKDSNKNYLQNGDWNLSFQEAVNAMKTAFLKRWQWMDENLPNL